ncbi:MAG: hypothetical protein JNM42_14305 [Propionivibrio sp.]|uniref:hypothetical protein n=1 Tax=Propionivibrio sp. TaxID=2212460 RepID=UPI001A568DD9|nr:hypothetical protein [Propionivibrio sp.]MBL8415608.1 hypothetical protein [Propionivibrio sp.]
MKPKQRWMLIGGLLLATLVAGYLVDDEPVAEKSPRRKAASASTVAASGATKENRRTSINDKMPETNAAPLSFPEPADAGESEPEGEKEEEKEIIDPFRNKSWYVAPPPLPPPKPVAPPLPFQYLGKLSEDGQISVFLNHQGRYLIARKGDVIDGIYRVEEIAGSRMTLLYQPLKERQVLSIGSEK